MASLIQMIVGKKLTPEEQVKKWRTTIRQQERDLDRQIRGIETEELKIKQTLKQAAKRGDNTTLRMLGREVVRARKAREKMFTSKAQLNSMVMHLQQQLSIIKVAGAMQKSTDMMKLANSLIKLPELSAQMQEMSQEMMKAGIIEEMIDDTLAMNEEDGVEEEAEEEVEKVLMELTQGILGKASAATSSLEPVELEKAVKAVDTKEDDEMERRLKALQN